jgi:hypothetical protein
MINGTLSILAASGISDTTVALTIANQVLINLRGGGDTASVEVILTGHSVTNPDAVARAIVVDYMSSATTSPVVPGPTGPQGIPGVPGMNGAIGPQGVAGTNGRDGSDGDDGGLGPLGWTIIGLTALTVLVLALVYGFVLSGNSDDIEANSAKIATLEAGATAATAQRTQLAHEVAANRGHVTHAQGTADANSRAFAALVALGGPVDRLRQRTVSNKQEIEATKRDVTRVEDDLATERTERIAADAAISADLAKLRGGYYRLRRDARARDAAIGDAADASAETSAALTAFINAEREHTPVVPIAGRIIRR